MSTPIVLIVALLISAYLLVLALLYINQEQMIFPRPPADPGRYQEISELSVEQNIGDTTLRGWRIAGAAPDSGIHVLYFGGNAEDTSGMLPILAQLAVSEATTLNYRGYGASDGLPSQQALLSDALVIYDQLNAQEPEKKVVLIGRSLGSAVAGYIAANRSVEKLVLITPLHSIEKIALENFHNLIPRFILRHPLPLAETAPLIMTPTLVLIAGKDSIIPNEHSMATYRALAGDKTLTTIDDADHNNVFEFPKSLRNLNTFLQGADVEFSRSTEPQQ